MAKEPGNVVADYFDREAAGYDGLTESGPLRFIRRMESDAVFRHVGNVEGLDVLEIGCGAGFYTRRLVHAGAGHVWAVDLSAAMLANLTDPCITTVQGDATTFSLDRTFPVILSAGLIEFLPDPPALFANAARHADRGARLIVFGPRPSPVGHVYRLFHRRHGLRIGLFREADMRDIGASAGWQLRHVGTCPPFGIIAAYDKI